MTTFTPDVRSVKRKYTVGGNRDQFRTCIFSTLFTHEGLIILAAATILILLIAISVLFIGYTLLKIPYSILMGMTATQPAVLDFSLRQTGNKLPYIGFTTMLPIKLVVILFIVQVLYLLLG